MTDGTPSPEPLAVSPAAGTDADASVPPPTPIPPHRPFWARLDSPFTVGFLLTIGGLAAFVLGVAVSNIATVIIYIALAMFAALGLDPVIRWLDRHNVKRPWAIAIVFLIFGVLGAGLLWLVVPTLIDQIAEFFAEHPHDDHQLRELRHLRLARGDLRTGPDHPGGRGAEVPARPREHRGDRRAVC